MIDLSKAFKNAVINLYKEGIYTVDYAIIEASKLADKNKIKADDYEELMTYLVEQQTKEMEEETKEDTETTDESQTSGDEIIENQEVINNQSQE